MIRVGTLCEMLGAWDSRTMNVALENGRFCEVKSAPRTADWFGLSLTAYDVEFPCGLRSVAAEAVLRPIVPPGDPDAEPHDVSEPELLEVYR